MDNTATILANEITAHLTAGRALEVGDLAVFTDYRNQQIGCRVVRMWAAGEISSEAQIEIRIVGKNGFYSGAKITVDASKVRGAI